MPGCWNIKASVSQPSPEPFIGELFGQTATIPSKSKCGVGESNSRRGDKKKISASSFENTGKNYRSMSVFKYGIAVFPSISWAWCWGTSFQSTVQFGVKSGYFDCLRWRRGDKKKTSASSFENTGINYRSMSVFEYGIAVFPSISWASCRATSFQSTFQFGVKSSYFDCLRSHFQ